MHLGEIEHLTEEGSEEEEREEEEGKQEEERGGGRTRGEKTSVKNRLGHTYTCKAWVLLVFSGLDGFF